MSSLGSPAEYGWVIAENAGANPWSSLNTDLGVSNSDSAVTLMGAEGMRGVIGIGRTSDEYLKLVADHMVGLAAQWRHWPVVVLIVAKDTAGQLARDGYTKDSIREGILKYVNVPPGKESTHRPQTNPGSNPPADSAKSAAPQLVIDQFLIFVAGGVGEKSMIIPGWVGATKAVTKEIRLPANWPQLLTGVGR
jgi:hypothetical protein